MKINTFNFLFAKGGADGNGSGNPPPSDKEETATREVKAGMVKVRATGQPVNVDGTHIPNGKGESAHIHEKHLPRLGGLVTKVGCLLACLFLGFTAAAQVYQNDYLPLTNGSAILLNGANTNCGFAAGGTLTINDTITCTKHEEVGLLLSSAAMAASTSNTVWQIDYGPDTNNFVSMATITYAQTGTTPVKVYTNLYVGSAGYLRVTSCASTTSIVGQTNVLAKRIFKPVRHGE